MGATATSTLPPQASIYTAELYAIKQALDFSLEKPGAKFVILTDSYSAVTSLQSQHLNDQIVRQFQHYVYAQKQEGQNISIC